MIILRPIHTVMSPREQSCVSQLRVMGKGMACKRLAQVYSRRSSTVQPSLNISISLLLYLLEGEDAVGYSNAQRERDQVRQELQRWRMALPHQRLDEVQVRVRVRWIAAPARSGQLKPVTDLSNKLKQSHTEFTTIKVFYYTRDSCAQ